MTKDQTKKTILIVEDDLPILGVLSDKLVREGFNVLQAKDGLEGLKIALKGRPDLILLDIIMPRLDGISMMKRLRVANKWGEKVKIIILTNLSPCDGKLGGSFIKKEPGSYLVKSNWSLNTLVERVRKTLE